MWIWRDMIFNMVWCEQYENMTVIKETLEIIQ